MAAVRGGGGSGVGGGSGASGGHLPLELPLELPPLELPPLERSEYACDVLLFWNVLVASLAAFLLLRRYVAPDVIAWVQHAFGGGTDDYKAGGGRSGGSDSERADLVSHVAALLLYTVGNGAVAFPLAVRALAVDGSWLDDTSARVQLPLMTVVGMHAVAVAFNHRRLTGIEWMNHIIILSTFVMFLAEGKLIRWFCVMTAVRLSDVLSGMVAIVAAVAGDSATPSRTFAALRGARLAVSVAARSGATMYGIFGARLAGLVMGGSRPWFQANFFTHMALLTVIVTIMWLGDAAYFVRRWQRPPRPPPGAATTGVFELALGGAPTPSGALTLPVAGSGASSSGAPSPRGATSTGGSGATESADDDADSAAAADGTVVRRKVR